MASIRLFTKNWCPYCNSAKQLLKSRRLAFDEVDVRADEAEEARLIAETGHRTVPQIFIGDDFIGGFHELARLHRSGGLDERLEAQVCAVC